MKTWEHLVRYYDHLHTLSGGTLWIDPSKIVLWKQPLYQVHIGLRWNGKDYGTSFRLDARSAVSAKPWGDPDHPLVYQTAVALREFCKALQSNGCDYALPEGH